MKRTSDIIAIAALLLAACSAPQPVRCEMAADCDDGNGCTADRCDPVAETCSNAPVVDGTTCDDDGLSGVCVSGVCSQGMCAGVNCDDGDECTTDLCDFADGSCSNTPVSDGTACDFDGMTGVCAAGECIEDRCVGDSCDDDNECTNDLCDSKDGICANTPIEDYLPCGLDEDAGRSAGLDGGVDLDGGIDPDGGVGPDGGIPPAGYCLNGVCVLDYCVGNPCDDENPCTSDYCAIEDASCTYFPRPDGTPCMDDLGMCQEGACIELPFCGDGRVIPGTAMTEEGRLRCEVQLGGLSAGVVLTMAATPLAEVQPGENHFELQVEFGVDAETVEDALQRGIRVFRIDSIAATIDATMGDSDPTPAAVEEAPVPCTRTLEYETPAVFASPPVHATWTLDVGTTLELTLQHFEEVLTASGNEITLSTLGPSANCAWETDLPSVSFTVVR
jgi:hypothetical protein